MWVKLTQDVEFICSDGPFSGKAGEVVEVNDRLGSHLVNLYGGVKVPGPADEGGEPEAPAIAPEVIEAVKAVIEEGNPDDFTKQGQPKVDAVRTHLPEKYEVSVDDVRVAFEVLMSDGDG